MYMHIQLVVLLFPIDQALSATYEENLSITTTTEKTSNSTRFKIMSWNTDTTDSAEIESYDLLEKRTEAIINLILREKPDVVLLQQVGTFALTFIITSLSTLYDEESAQIAPPDNCNYVSIFTRKTIIQKRNSSILCDSNNCQMLKVEAIYKNSINLDLFTSMNNQLSFCFEQMIKSHSDHIVLFGTSAKIADNLWYFPRTKIYDLWEITGQRVECAYTFDSQFNTNIIENKIRARYDRLFWRPSSSSINVQFLPVYMELEGIQRIKMSHLLFPSCHWAIQCYVDVNI